jgi:NAD dependent epimerase/dehydratase family
MLATTRLDGELVCGRRVCLRGRQLARKEAFSSDARCARDEAGARTPPLRFLAELATTPPDADRGAFSRQSAAPAAACGGASYPDVLRCSTTMRILVAGASGVVGRATLPHLTRHDVAGLTRSPEKLGSLRDLGAEPMLCDVYDHERLLRVTQRFRPRIVADFLTDLSAGSVQGNDRIAGKAERICSTPRGPQLRAGSSGRALHLHSTARRRRL